MTWRPDTLTQDQFKQLQVEVNEGNMSAYVAMALFELADVIRQEKVRPVVHL